ncbi:MAG: hypothetical protein OMM_06031 [Candidatus Magnetoglobus multicellularis str. Araruama]|uniref:Uncharacterized protein n=1 Tax=Candidatus Magnetoglobus multicellularis str. Araruama TaxID=890399 RepID=A0A1V1NSF2_9BACT|nr:MAG: hypothetical protein OMM_06031 [Candidatus Magnetoglobus multicellularis str. Araruama]
MIGVKYGKNSQISAEIECDGDEPIPLNDKHQLIGFNDEYLVCAYNFSNDNPEKINIYYDHNQRFSIPVHFHKKRPTYVTTKENSLFFWEIADKPFVSSKPFIIRGPSIWVMNFNSEIRRKEVVKGIDNKTFVVLLKPDESFKNIAN